MCVSYCKWEIITLKTSNAQISWNHFCTSRNHRTVMWQMLCVFCIAASCVFVFMKDELGWKELEEFHFKIVSKNFRFKLFNKICVKHLMWWGFLGSMVTWLKSMRAVDFIEYLSELAYENTWKSEFIHQIVKMENMEMLKFLILHSKTAAR